LLQIAAESNKHIHGVYLGPRGFGLTSPAKDGHVHEVIQSESGEWVLLEAEGHSHDLRDLTRKPNKSKKKSEEKRTQEVLSLYKEANQIEDNSITKGDEAFNFYLGDQWDKRIKAKLEGEKRAALTINEVASKVDLLQGFQAQNRTDVIVRPMEDSDEALADIYNMLIKHVLDQNDYIYKESEVFKDQTVAGRGQFMLSVDMDENPEGDIIIDHFNWRKVRLGPHEKLDQKDLEYMIKKDKFSKAKVKQLFPKKADEIETMFASLEELKENDGFDVKGQNYKLARNRHAMILDGETLVDVQRKELTIMEMWKKEYKVVKLAIFPVDSFVESLEDVPAKEVKQILAIEGMEDLDRNEFDMRVTKTAGDVFLESKILELPEGARDFHTLSVYGKKYGNHFQGKVEDVKDVQREINKRSSQIVDIMNRVVPYGWFVDKDTFKNPTDVDKFKKTSAQAGFVQEVRDLNKTPQRVEGIRFPQELANLATIATQKLDLLMGIPPEASGFGAASSSGRAILLKRRQSLVANDFLFDNMSRVKKKLVKMIIAYIQEIYTPERILRIISGSQAGQGIDIKSNVLNVVNDDPQQVLDLLNNKDAVKFDIVLEESTHTSSMKDYTFLAMSELAQQGVPIPPDEIIAASPFPNKARLMEKLGIQQQQAAASEASAQETEAFKSMPPELQIALAQKGSLPSSLQPQQQGKV
jgi:hypothetical protein